METACYIVHRNDDEGLAGIAAARNGSQPRDISASCCTPVSGLKEAGKKDLDS